MPYPTFGSMFQSPVQERPLQQQQPSSPMGYGQGGRFGGFMGYGQGGRFGGFMGEPQKYQGGLGTMFRPGAMAMGGSLFDPARMQAGLAAQAQLGPSYQSMQPQAPMGASDPMAQQMQRQQEYAGTMATPAAYSGSMATPNPASQMMTSGSVFDPNRAAAPSSGSIYQSQQPAGFSAPQQQQLQGLSQSLMGKTSRF